MFKKKFIFKIVDSEVLDLCRILGKYGVKFEIGKLNTVANADDPFCALHYRLIAVYASERQIKKLCNELNGNDF